MRKTDLSSLEKARKKAFEKYQSAKQKLSTPPEDFSLIPLMAQEANAAWEEFKKLDVDFQNSAILKKMGDLYGC